MSDGSGPAVVPRTFLQYLRSLGPGLVIALTWLGAGDLVDAAVAGANYGYALMWGMAIAVLIRFVFVSIMAKYQLCNPHGETLLAGLARIHRFFPAVVAAIGLVFGHIYGSYLVKGVGEASSHLVGYGAAWLWSVVWIGVALVIVFRNVFAGVEKVFYVLLGLLSVSLIGVALWSGPKPVEIAKGLLFDLPPQRGPFGALFVVMSLIGAVGGSIANFFYPYFITQKGWVGPHYRKVQMYDLLFGTLALLVLNLAVWTAGAEILNPRGIVVSGVSDLARILTEVLGALGGPIFYLGVLAAVFSSMVGNAIGYSLILVDAVEVSRGRRPRGATPSDDRGSRIYRAMTVWCLVTPLVWTLPGTPGFVFLTLTANALSVVVLPILCGGVWIITSRTSCVGRKYRNRWWEHTLLLLLFVLAIYGALQSAVQVAHHVNGG